MRRKFGPLMILASGLLLSSAAGLSQQASEPYNFFRGHVGLNSAQIEALRRGKPITTVLDSKSADQVFIFGSIFIEADPVSYIKLATDIEALRKLPHYLAVRKFSDPPRLSDLDGFTLEPDDALHLKRCKSGQCEVQLPSEAMEQFQRSVNWSAPDAAAQVNRVAQQMALEALGRYMQGGNAALGTYRDKDHPAVVAETFQVLLNRAKALPAYLPDLDHYLLHYPNSNLSAVESEFYWEKVDFGLKPTLRILQAVVYRGKDSAGPVAVAIKQLYSSHYFRSALDLTVCVSEQRGFYLITLKGSQQAGLTGLKGSLIRRVAVDKTRSSLERSLVSIKQKLESEKN